MNVSNKSRNQIGIMAPHNLTYNGVSGKSVLLPSVGTHIPKKQRHAPHSNIKSPYERSVLTPPNRSRPAYCEKVRPSSNKSTSASASNLTHKKKMNPSSKKYAMIYSKLKRNNVAKLNEAIGLLQKPFDYSASFVKGNKTSVNRKTNLLDKRMSVFSNTYVANKKKILNELDNYNLTEKNKFDLNKTVDMIVQGSMSTKFKTDLNNYGNLLGHRISYKKDLSVKQKPAAPEIKKKAINPLSQINPSFSDTNILEFSNVSSVKSFNRPKSMERLKRKPTNKKKQAKSKPKKKTKRKYKDEFSTFDHTGSMIVTHQNDIKKSLGRDRSANDRLRSTQTHANRKAKLDQEIK